MIDYVFLEEFGIKISVLFVEDDEGISKEMGLLLGDIFQKVQVANDGQEGLKKYIEYFKTNKKHVDIVITDISMPNMDGIELINEIYKINPSQKILVLSAHNEPKYLMPLINIGVEQFILKPIDYDNFIEIIYNVSKAIYEKHYSFEDNVFFKLANNLLWNKKDKKLLLNNDIYKLTRKEFLLIDLLMKIPEKVYTNEEIISYLWKDEVQKNPDVSNLKNLISRLRKKLPDLNIENIYSFGYRLIPIN